MKDMFLQLAAKFAESEPPLELDVTLIVGGFLVSGFVVSKDKYFNHHPFPQQIIEAYDELECQSPLENEEQQAQDERHYIHLRDAKYFTPGQLPIPGNAAVYCRISLENVSGFSFGLLQPEVV